MMKIAGSWWRSSKDHQEEKEAAKEMAKRELKKYNKIMEIYEPPSQEELRRRLKEMPKRYRVNWNFYVKEKFAPLYKKYLSFGIVARALGQKWRKLSESEKKPYNQMYKKDRRRWEREMEKFRAKYEPRLHVNFESEK